MDRKRRFVQSVLLLAAFVFAFSLGMSTVQAGYETVICCSYQSAPECPVEYGHVRPSDHTCTGFQTVDQCFHWCSACSTPWGG